MRLRVSGPVSSIFCLPTRPNFGSSVGSSTSVAQACSTPRGPNFLRVVGVLLAGVVELLRLLFGVQVVEIAEPFVEAVHGRQELVAIAQVVLAELAGGVALRLQDFGQRRIGLLDAARRAGNADRRHAGADGHLPDDERGAARSAARLAVVIGEEHAFLGDAVDVRRAAHHAVRIGADVPHADVVAEDDPGMTTGFDESCAVLGAAAARLRRDQDYGNRNGISQSGSPRWVPQILRMESSSWLPVSHQDSLGGQTPLTMEQSVARQRVLRAAADLVLEEREGRVPSPALLRRHDLPLDHHRRQFYPAFASRST